MTGIFRDRRGASAIEFALAAPLLVLALIGIAQLGLLLMADTALRANVAEGARFATLYPRPSDADIAERMAARRFQLDPGRLTAPSFSHGTADGADYVEISLSYDLPLNFVFFRPAPVRLTRTRRAFIVPLS
jgi:Flp pilus assembly protein TadG